MQLRSLFIVLTLGLAAMSAPAYAATCAPAKLVHIVLTNITPGTEAGSFNALPRTYYRIGNDRIRIEEGLDQANGIHGLVVVAEPNIWMINLVNNTGRHIIDPGPTFNAVAPVIAIPGLSAKLAGLQLGCESDFLTANAVAPSRVERIGGVSFSVYRISDGSDAIELLERQQTQTPAYVRYFRDGKLNLALRYDVYETGLANDPILFQPPANVRLSEAGQ